MLDEIEELNKWSKNTVDTLHYTSWQFSRGQTHAKNHIVEKWKNYYDDIYIVWHSMWWDSAVEFSNTLAWMNINVTGLYTLDIEWMSDDTNVMSNVANAENYYQTHTWKWHYTNVNWALLTWKNENYTNIKTNSFCSFSTTCEVDSEKDFLIDHTSMDDKMVKHLSNKIYNSFNN